MGRVGRLNTEYYLGVTKQRYQYGGAGIPFVKAPYGDQPADSSEIASGYAYQAAGCKQ